MRIADEHTSAIERLGYTPEEAQFLYFVATFSGYFLPRQFVAFAGIKWGKRSANFTAKLERHGHATWREYFTVGGVYQLSSKTLYRAIDRENLRNHRRHSAQFIRTRLLLLDFVLANQTFEYLETEEEKIRHFHRAMGIPLAALPGKSYSGPAGGDPAIRYFVDRFPLFFETAEDRAACRVTLSYVDAGEATLAGLTHHLVLYLPLLRRLPQIRFIYISNSPVHFASAEKRFESCLDRRADSSGSGELLRYFRLRSAWDRKHYASLSQEDIEWLENANARLRTPDLDNLFALWSTGTVSDDELVQSSNTPRNVLNTRFAANLVAPGLVLKQVLGKEGEA
jgi:hypothetical protein